MCFKTKKEESAVLCPTRASGSAKLLLAVPSHVKLLFAGDDRQLPPVNDVSIIPELKDNSLVKTVELTKVFRSDDKVLSMAHGVLKKEMIEFNSFSDDDLSFIVNDLISNGYQILTNTKKMTKTINLIVQHEKSEITRCYNDFKYNLGDRVMLLQIVRLEKFQMVIQVGL